MKRIMLETITEISRVTLMITVEKMLGGMMVEKVAEEGKMHVMGIPLHSNKTQQK